MRRVLSIAFASSLMACSVLAQNTDIEALSGLNFNFANPGARSLGMGGAFIGLADDASAAEANPAGLTILRKLEISIEGRNYETSQTYNVGGTFPDLTQADFNAFSRSAEVSFGSVVIPVGRGSIAAYYHQPLNYQNEILNIFGETDPRTGVFNVVPITFFLGPSGPTSQADCDRIGAPGCQQYNLFPFFTGVDIKMQTAGLAGAYSFGKLSIGAAARYHEFKEVATTFRTDFDTNPLSQITQTSDTDDVTFTAGFKWAMSERFSVGGVYKQGAQFDAPVFFESVDDPLTQLDTPSFHVPDIIGVGLSLRPVPVLTINADAIQVNYSNLTDDFRGVLGAPNSGYTSEDVTELHFGAEYFFTSRIPVAIRGGYWRDPAHSTEFTGPLTTFQGVAARILYPPGQDQDHYSVGVGLAWPNFQIDAAYETSDTFKVGSISAVTRF